MFGKDKEPEAPYEGQKWEYRTEKFVGTWWKTDKWDALGARGWELVIKEDGFFVFKRKVAS